MKCLKTNDRTGKNLRYCLAFLPNKGYNLVVLVKMRLFTIHFGGIFNNTLEFKRRNLKCL